MDPAKLRTDDFESFIDSRRMLLLERIGKAMGKPVVATGEAVADGDIEEEGQE